MRDLVGTKVLVTGGTGLIGQPLIKMLLDVGAKVTVASLDSPALCPPEAEFFRGDLTHPDFVASVVAGQQFVFHLAGVKGAGLLGQKKSASFLVPIVLMNTHVMEACRQSNSLEFMVYTSSIGVYPPGDIFSEAISVWDHQPHYNDRYGGWAKRMGELLLETYIHEYNWRKAVIVRPSAIYGPHDNFDPKSAMVIPALIARFHTESPVEMYGDGKSLRDFLYADDAAQGILLAVQHGKPGNIYNLGSGRVESVRDVVDCICNCLTNPPEVVWDKLSMDSGQRVRLMDVSKAKYELDFSPNFTLQEGIEEAIAWYRAIGGPSELRHNAFGDK